MYKEGAALSQDSHDDLPLLQGKHLVLAYHADATGVVDHYMVTAGTIELLVERLADENHPDTSYIEVFLLGYRYLLSAPVFLEKLTTRFNVVPPPHPTPEQQQYYNTFASVIKVRVLSVLKKWIDSYWGDFESNLDVLQNLGHFLDLLASDRDKSIAGLGVRLKTIVAEKKKDFKSPRTDGTAFFDGAPCEHGHINDTTFIFVVLLFLLDLATRPQSKRNLEFTILDAKEFAHQLTLVDFERFTAIHPSEFVIRLWEGAGSRTRNLTQMIMWSNRISYFTATEICIQPDLKKRARLLESFIKVAKECHRVQNFNSLMAVLSGLNNSSVRRLKRTWALITPKALKELGQLEEVMAGTHNFGKYREVLARIEAEEDSGPCIPFLGLILRDLTFLNDGNPKKFKGGLYNFTKLRRVSEIVFALGPFQSTPYSFRSSRVSHSVKDYLQNPYAIVDDEALYKCSLLLEPKGEEDGTPQPIRLIEKWSKESGKSLKK